MKKVAILSAVLLLSGILTGGARELKKQILGPWIVDEEATIERFMESDKIKKLSKSEAKAEVRKFRAFVRRADMEFRFYPESIKVTNKGQTTTHRVKVNRASGKVIIYDSDVSSLRTHRQIQFRVTFQDKNSIAIYSSDTKDLDLYVWKRSPTRGKTKKGS